MSRKTALIYTIFGVVALISIIAVFSIRVYFERTDSVEQNNLVFKDLQNSVASSYLAKGSFSHSFFSSSMRKYIDDHDKILSVVVYSAESPYYIFSKDPDIITFSRDEHILSWNGAPIFTIRPLLEEVTSKRVAIPTQEGTYVSAVFTLLHEDKLFLFIRDAIISIAGLLVITIIFIAVYPAIQKKSYAGSREDPSPVTEKIEEHIPHGQVSNKAHEEPPTGDEPKVKQPSPGLFSPETGLGWEQFLDSRLSFELRRSASYDQDLVLILFRGEDIQRGTPEFINVAKYLLKHFLFQDMLFEYEHNGFSVILPNTELDFAIKEVETFRKNVCGKKVSNCIFSAGLSSRNGRLINGNRLITEASMALSKAFNDPNNKVIAFRPDPEKYRQYIASQK